MNMKNYVADELYNKVYHLNQTLNKAQVTIATLEEENRALKTILEKIETEKTIPGCTH